MEYTNNLQIFFCLLNPGSVKTALNKNTSDISKLVMREKAIYNF